MDAFALIFTFLAVGAVFARLRLLPDNAAQTVNVLILYVCLPAMVLQYVPKLKIGDSALPVFAATPWLLAFLAWALLAQTVARRAALRAHYPALLMCSMMGSTGFIGFPLVEVLIGGHAVPYAVVYDQFGTFLILFSVGVYLLHRHGANAAAAPPSLRTTVKNILRSPLIWVMVFALLVMPENPPAWIADGLNRLSGALLPLVMINVGLSLRLKMVKSEVDALAVGLVLKLLLMPAAALLFSWALGLHGDLLRVNVLESAMPPMITAAAMAIAGNFSPRLSAALVGYGTLLAVVTLPLWLKVLAVLGF